MGTTETFNDRLERLLADKKMQKKELAEKIGVSQNGISTWKATGVIPRADIAIKIAKELDVSVEYLVTGELSEVKNNRLALQIASLSEDKQKIIKALADALELF